VAAALADLPVDVWPSAANFVLFRPRQRDGDQVWKDLVERSVLVRNCASWPRLDGCLRVTIGTPAEDDAFLDALREVLR
jgi:histidinol-phosphate aminotransferase